MLASINSNPPKRQLDDAVNALRALNGYQDSEALIEHCLKRIDEMEAEQKRRKEENEERDKARRYQNVLVSINSNPPKCQLDDAVNALRALNGYQDSEALIEHCLKRIDEMEMEAEQKRREKAHQVYIMRQEQSKLQTELANLRGLFTGKRRRELEAKLAEIEKKIEQKLNE